MATQPHLTMGTNRTGIKASPMDSAELLETLDMHIDADAAINTGADATAPMLDADALRAAYLEEADAVGTMPPPTNLKGMVGAAIQSLTGRRLHMLLDKLGERAAYERTGTRLYDAMLRRAAVFELPPGMTWEAVREIRNEEARHFLMLCEAIESLGGDPTTQTPCADVAGVQGMGLVQTMGEPRITIAQALETLLAAELIDNASWDLLIELTRDFGQDELAARFAVARSAEQIHLDRVQGWLRAALKQDAALGG